jgi:hypothetical protein
VSRRQEHLKYKNESLKSVAAGVACPVPIQDVYESIRKDGKIDKDSLAEDIRESQRKGGRTKGGLSVQVQRAEEAIARTRAKMTNMSASPIAQVMNKSFPDVQLEQVAQKKQVERERKMAAIGQQKIPWQSLSAWQPSSEQLLEQLMEDINEAGKVIQELTEKRERAKEIMKEKYRKMGMMMASISSPKKKRVKEEEEVKEERGVKRIKAEKEVEVKEEPWNSDLDELAGTTKSMIRSGEAVRLAEERKARETAAIIVLGEEDEEVDLTGDD